MRHLSVSVLTCALLAGAAFAADQPTDSSADTSGQPDGTVNLTGGSVAVGIGYVWGSGELSYQGTKHKFKLSGISVVDVGAAHITATGNVYNLKSLNDFNGNYATLSAGVTVAGGGSAAVLRNDHGVVIKIISTTQGLQFNLSANGIDIKLKK